MSAGLNGANEIRLLNHDMVLAYCFLFLIAISSANRLWYLKHPFPIPPVVVKTKGVNVPCSMSRTLLEYRRFLSFSWIRQQRLQQQQQRLATRRSLYDSAFGCQTLTSMNADRWCSQNPRAWISNLASCALLDSEMSWRAGSVSTLLHTVLRSLAS